MDQHPESLLPSTETIDLQQHKILLRKHVKVKNLYIVTLIACLCPTISMTMYGYMTATWPRLIEGSLAITATPEQISLLTSISPACSIVGPLINTYFINHIGRKYTICLFYIPYIIMASLLLLGTSYTTFFISSCFGMANWLLGYSLASVYISEVSAPHLRSSLCALVSLMGSLGMTAGYIMASQFQIKAAGVIFLTYCVVAVVLSSRNLDSPYFLLQKSKKKQARKNLQVLYEDEAVEKELNRLQQAVDKVFGPDAARGWSTQIFRERRYLVSFLLNLNLLFIISFSGGDPIIINRPKILRQGCYKLITVETAEVLTPIFATGAQVLFTLIVSYVCRRKLYIFSVLSTALSVLSLGLYYAFKDSNEWLANTCDFFPFSFLLWFSSSLQIGVYPIPFMYFREFIPANIVGISTFLLDTAMPIFSFASVAIFEYIVVSFSYFLGFFFMFVCAIFGLTIFILYAPDTQEKFLEEAEMDLKREHDECDI